ncbi:MAG: hypothetical protein GWP06_04905 [Actinobacteria bacterium]|nr:hypothetical protein [Actinomycetota bacterium]
MSHAQRQRQKRKNGSGGYGVAQHLFHGAHDPGKLAGAIEIRMHPEEREVEYDGAVVLKVQLFNGKCGHKVPTGSVEDRIMWLDVTAKDANGKEYHLPVDKKGFKGEEYTIAADELAYKDIGIAKGIPDFPGLQRDGVPIGDRIFRMPYFDANGVMTIMQWNTKSLGVDYRIGPREIKIETYTWKLPEDIPTGKIIFTAKLNYQKLVKPVADYLGVPAFARRYKISCTTCHSPFPRLKPYGDEFAGNGFILKENEKSRDYISAGDDMLWLNRTFPIAVRFDAFGVYEPKSEVKTDFQSPWGLKLLSGGTLAKNIGYYFYFYMSERGEIAGIEDAYIHFDNVFGINLDIMVGQFQTSDPIWKRELRLTFEDYMILKQRFGPSRTNLTYERGVTLTYNIEKTGTDFAILLP